MNIQQLIVRFLLCLPAWCTLAAVPAFAQTIITHVPLYTFDADSRNGVVVSVSGAGDVNGDGFADLIFGVPSNIESDAIDPPGSARVFSGADGSVLYNFDGDAGTFGGSVSGAGDVNGDGLDDLIVGAKFNTIRIITDGGAGTAQVFSGSDGGLLYDFSGTEEFGFSVSGAGDVNGDGFADLIVGARDDGVNDLLLSGSARVLSGVDGSLLHTFEGNRMFQRFGRSVSGAGDVNSDGFDDLIVGSEFGPPNVQVFSGSDGSVLHTFDGDLANGDFGDSVSGAGDVNGDGFADLIVGAPNTVRGSAQVFSGFDGTVLYTFEGDSFDDEFGTSVSGTGDVNDDGFDDVIVGAPRDSNSGFFSGSARVFSGVDGSVLYTFNGDSAVDSLGWSVSGAGDVNNDGVADFIVGANRGGGNDGGYARVFVSRIIILGDANQDGEVTFADISSFIAILQAGTFLEQADCNQDGVVDFADIPAFIAILQAI